MSSSWLSRLMLWLVTLFSPSHVVLVVYAGVNIYAPLWSVSYYGTFTFLVFISGQPWNPLAGLSVSAVMLFMTFPIVLATILLELIPRGIGRLSYARIMIFVYPAFILFMEAFFLLTGGGLFTLPFPLAALVQYLRFNELRQAPRVPAPMVSTTPAVSETAPMVEVLRGGTFVANKLEYKVKVVNKTNHVITDLNVAIISYPRDSLRLDTDASRVLAKLEPGGFRSPTFGFLPTQDCVKGDIIASVSYVDHEGKAHSMTAEPFTVRAVCDLLRPETITPDDFTLKLGSLESGEMTVKVEDWTPEEMHSKTIAILSDCNFFEVTSEIKPVNAHIEARVDGWAKGVYTSKPLGIQIRITGKSGVKGATCKVRMSGEDEAMIMPAIDEISQKLGAWLCPRCNGALSVNLVTALKAGKSSVCPYCGVTIDR